MQHANLVNTVQKQLDFIDSLIDAVGRLADTVGELVKMHDELRWRVRFLEAALESVNFDLGDTLEDADYAA